MRLSYLERPQPSVHLIELPDNHAHQHDGHGAERAPRGKLAAVREGHITDRYSVSGCGERELTLNRCTRSSIKSTRERN